MNLKRNINTILENSIRFQLHLKTITGKVKERLIPLAEVNRKDYGVLCSMIYDGLMDEYSTWMLSEDGVFTGLTRPVYASDLDDSKVYVISFNENKKLKRYIRKTSSDESLHPEYYSMKESMHLSNIRASEIKKMDEDKRKLIQLNNELYRSIRKDIIEMASRINFIPSPVEGKMFFDIESLQYELNHLRMCDYELLGYSDMELLAVVKKFRFTEEINDYIKEEIKEIKGTRMRTFKAIHIMLTFAYNPELLKKFKKIEIIRR